MPSLPSAAVTAVIPVFNGADYLESAIRSVLAQTRRVAECIVVDDGSTDATADVAQRFASEVTYVRQPARGGVSAARNRGAALASAELIAFLDHDDEWDAAKLERQLQLFADPAVTLAVCALRVVDAAGTELEIKRLGATDGLVNGMLMFDGTPTLSCSSSGVVRRERFLELGGFDEGLSMSADWDLLLRMLLEGKVAYVDEPLVLYRVHDGNMSRRVELMETDMRRSFAKAFTNPALPPELQERQRKAYGRLYRMLAGSYRDHCRSRDAARLLALAVRNDPRILVELARRP
jgi:glycosyltransferase involved in cell wall biosynthesis